MEEVWKILGELNKVIDSNELAQAIKEKSFDGEYALSEEGLESISLQTAGLMNTDAAIRNKDIKEALAKELKLVHKKSFLSKVEDDLKPTFEALNMDVTGVEFLSDKASEIAQHIEALKESKGGDGKHLETIKAERAAREAIQKEKETLQEEYENKLREQKTGFSAQQIRDKVILKANSKQWASIFDEKMKKSRINDFINDLSAKADLKLSDNGEILLFQKDNPELEYMDGNKKVLFQTLLDQEIDPYMQKSNPAPAPSGKLQPDNQVELTPQQASLQRNYKEYASMTR